MFQEIITYIIIASAFILAGYKFYLKFFKKKVRNESISLEKSNLKLHKCDDCSAECMLRDTIKPMNLNNQNLCRKIKVH